MTERTQWQFMPFCFCVAQASSKVPTQKMAVCWAESIRSASPRLPHVERQGGWSDGYPGAGGASAVTISQSLIGMKRATQSACLRAGRPIIPMDISFRTTHAGKLRSDLHGLASLTGTCPSECCFSDAYSESSGACRQRRIYIYWDTLTKTFMLVTGILLLSVLRLYFDNHPL